MYKGRGKKQQIYKNTDEIDNADVKGNVVYTDLVKIADLESFSPDAHIELTVSIEDIEVEEK